MKKKEKSVIQHLMEFTKKHRKYYIVSVILAIIGVIFSIAPYYIISKGVLELINKNKDMNVYIELCLIMAGMWVVRVLCHMLSSALSHKATFAVIGEIRVRIANKLTKVPMGYIIDTPSGKVKNIMVEKIDSIEPTLAHVVPEMTANLLGPLLTIIYLFTIDYRIAIASLLTVPAGIIPFCILMKSYEKNYKNYVEKNKILNAVAIEYINGIEVIKAFNQSAGSYKKFTTATKEAAYAAINWMKRSNLYFSIAMSVFPAVLVSVLPIGCILYINGLLTMESFIVATILSLGIIMPLITAMSYTDELARIGTIINDITEITEQEDLIRPNKRQRIKDYNIEIKNVSFSYHTKDDKAEDVIKNINLEINQGDVTAIVGPSGGGKSTIAKLIASFWDTTNGDIFIGGTPIKQIPLSQLNEVIAYVSQDNYLFNDTVRNNIRMGNINATDTEVEECAKKSGCHDFIMKLENGYETKVGDAGGQISGGERQRISIARAILKNAPIIILDEATAYTDPENEAIMQESIAKLVKGKTLLVIAHRLSTIVDVDKIVVIKGGKVEAEGKHKHLIENCKLYSSMWNAHISAKDTLADNTQVKEGA
ncbi:ABC transporter ATP-binding protein [Clostridiaceae bacterium M8S5]|nr:ABC transporter ATP-binding protein [Clostridiaceae bacterium M8S5]